MSRNNTRYQPPLGPVVDDDGQPVPCARCGQAEYTLCLAALGGVMCLPCIAQLAEAQLGWALTGMVKQMVQADQLARELGTGRYLPRTHKSKKEAPR